jgi:hypothetical protein
MDRGYRKRWEGSFSQCEYIKIKLVIEIREEGRQVCVYIPIGIYLQDETAIFENFTERRSAYCAARECVKHALKPRHQCNQVTIEIINSSLPATRFVRWARLPQAVRGSDMSARSFKIHPMIGAAATDRTDV